MQFSQAFNKFRLHFFDSGPRQKITLRYWFKDLEIFFENTRFKAAKWTKGPLLFLRVLSRNGASEIQELCQFWALDGAFRFVKLVSFYNIEV